VATDAVHGSAARGSARVVLFRRVRCPEPVARGEIPLVRSFVGVTVSSGVWSLAYAAQLSATTLEATLLWNRLVWVGVAALTVAWPVFVFVYVDWTAWIRPRRIALLCLVPATAVGGIFVVGADPIFTRLRRCPIRTGSS